MLGDPLDFGSFDDLGATRRQRRAASQFAPYPEEEEQSLIDKYILSKAKGGLQYAAETLDKPGRAVRGLLAGRPSELLNLVPFSDAMGLTDPQQSTSGRDLLESYGMLEANTPGLDWGDVAGFGAELLTDPLTWAGGIGALTKTGKAAQAAGKATKPLAEGIRAGERSLMSVGIPGGELLGLNKRLGIDDIPLGTGAKAADFAEKYIEKPINALRWSTPGMATARVMDKSVGNMQTKLGQELYPETVSNVLPSEVAKLTKPLHEDAREMLKAGVFDEDHIKAMTAGAEGTFEAYEKDAMGNLVAKPASQIAAAQTGEKVGSQLRRMMPEEYRAGLATEELADDFITYTARYHHSEQRGLFQGFAERFHKVKKFLNSSRLDELKGIPGGTNMIESVIQEPLVWDLPLEDATAKVMDMTGGLMDAAKAKDLAKWVRRQKRENFYDAVPTVTPGGTVTAWVPNGRRFFNADPITDAGIRSTRHAKQMAESTFVKEMAVQGSKKLDEIPAEEFDNYIPLAEAADMEGLTNRFGAIMGKASGGGSKWALSSEGIESRIARDLGINPHELTVRNAVVDGKPIKKNTIKGLQDRYVHKDIAADMQRAVNTWNKPEELAKLADLYDTGLTLWKTTQTGLWPAFHARNFIGGMYYHLTSGAAGTHSKASLAAAHALRKGDEIAPEILTQLGYKTTQEAIADAQAWGVLREGATFSDDAMGAASMSSPSAKMLGPIGTQPQSKLESIQAAWERAKGAAKSGEGKLGKVAATVDSIIDSSRRVGNFTEDVLRTNQFLARKMQGWTSEAAAMDVKKWYFNFDELTETERNVFKRVVPFYSWLRFNTPLVAKELLKRPGGPISQSMRLSQQGRQDQGYLPEHIGEQTAIPFGAPGRFITGLGLPYESAFNQLKIAPTVMKTLQRSGESMLAQSAPPISGAYSVMSGRDPYSGRELGDLYPYPTNSMLANLAINKTLGRGLTEYRKATDERKGWLPWALGATTGVKIEDLSGGLERQQQLESKRIIGNLLDESPHIKGFTNYYADPRQKDSLTPEELRNLKLMAGLTRKGREAAKKQKLTEQQKFLQGL